MAQGTEAGGHVSGQVSTFPLLQAVLEAVKVPVLAAGGIASPRGVAAALAAGAAGVWVGTALLASSECEHTEQARERIVSPTRDAEAAERFFVKALHSSASSAPQGCPVQEQVEEPTTLADPNPTTSALA